MTFETGSPQYRRGNTNWHQDILRNEEANKHYRYSSVEKLLNNTKDLIDMVVHHQTYQVPRLNILHDYAVGDNVGILSKPRKPNPAKSDVRVAHPYAAHIIDFNVGYGFGIPANIEYDDDTVNKELKVFNDINDVDALNAKLATTRATYGRAYEIQYRTMDGVDRVLEASVFNTFVVYDRTIEQKPIFGVYYTEENELFSIEMHTVDEIIYFDECAAGDKRLVIVDRVFHDREEVDITEIPNGYERQGDAETVIPIIDANDSIVSDIVNFKNDNNEATLILKGNIDEDMLDVEDETMSEAMRETDLMLLKARMDANGGVGSVDAEYLERTFDVAGFEAVNGSLKKNIYELSGTPDFNSESFANTTSGIAVRWKMYISDQRMRTKDHYFKNALRKRYRMWGTFKEWQEEIKEYDPNKLTVKTHTNLPVSYAEEITAHVKAGGKLSQETQLSQLSIVDDVNAEMARIAKEQNVLQGSMYDDMLIDPVNATEVTKTTETTEEAGE